MGPCQQSLKSGPIQDVHEHVQFTPSDLYRTLRTLWHRPDVLQGTQMFQCCVHIHRWPQKHCRYWLLELQILASRQIHKYRLIIDKCQMVLNAMEKSDGQIILDQVDLGGGDIWTGPSVKLRNWPCDWMKGVIQEEQSPAVWGCLAWLRTGKRPVWTVSKGRRIRTSG